MIEAIVGAAFAQLQSENATLRVEMSALRAELSGVDGMLNASVARIKELEAQLKFQQELLAEYHRLNVGNRLKTP